MKNTIILTCIFFFFSNEFSIAQVQTASTKIVQTYYNPIKQIGLHEQYSVLISNPAIKQGAYKELSDIGVVLTEGKYSNDLKTGKWTYRTEKGIIHGIENYNQKGEFNGEVISYSWGLVPDMAWNETVMCSYSVYLNGKKNGEEKFWYCGESFPKYTLENSGNYLDDKKNGEWIYYNETGKKEKTSIYDKDEETETKKYDTSGLLTYTYSNVKADSGKNHIVTETYFFSNGNKKQETIKLFGNSSLFSFLGNTSQATWYDSGELRAKWTYSEDSKTGTYECYFKSGKLAAKGAEILNATEYLDYGNYTELYESGGKKVECNFNKMGKTSGHQTAWYENGNKKEEGDWIATEGNGNQFSANVPNSHKANDWFYWSENGTLVSETGIPITQNGNINNEISQSDNLINEGKYDDAIKVLTDKINSGSATIDDYNQIGWCLILTKQYFDAKRYLLDGVELDETNLFIQGNFAHSLLLSGQLEQAKEIYMKYKSFNVTDKISWVDMVKSDFEEFKKAGLPSENFEVILDALK